MPSHPQSLGKATSPEPTQEKVWQVAVATPLQLLLVTVHQGAAQLGGSRSHPSTFPAPREEVS